METPHIPPRKILVPYDFSGLAMKAWELAQTLHAPLGASLEALFVYEAPAFMEAMTPLPMTPLVVNSLTPALKKSLLDDLRRDLGEKAALEVRQGFGRDEILKHVGERGVDMIVMGTHGRTGTGRVLFGSVAESLSRHSPVPVLTVREEWRPIESILVPLNFAEYSLAGFHAAAALAERLGARFDVLFVASEPYSDLLLETTFDALTRRLPPYFADKRPKLLKSGGKADERIIDEGGRYDLIVLVAHRKPLFRDLVLGTTAERVLRHAATPVLALPAVAAAKAAPRLKTAARRA